VRRYSKLSRVINVWSALMLDLNSFAKEVMSEYHAAMNRYTEQEAKQLGMTVPQYISHMASKLKQAQIEHPEWFENNDQDV
jgi:hypothetical protein